MKKAFMMLMASLLCSSAFAVKNKVTIKSGNISVLKETANMLLEMDYSTTTWEIDDDYKAWSGNDYEERVRVSHTAFKNRFNNVSKGLKIADNNAKYKMVFKVDNLEQHQGMSMWGRFTMAITGTIEIIEINTNKSVLVIDVMQAKGNPDYAMKDRIKEAFGELAERLYKLKK